MRRFFVETDPVDLPKDVELSGARHSSLAVQHQHRFADVVRHREVEATGGRISISGAISGAVGLPIPGDVELSTDEDDPTAPQPDAIVVGIERGSGTGVVWHS